MTEYAGTQVGADGKRHLIADVGDAVKPDSGDPESRQVTILPSAARTTGATVDPLFIGDRTQARLDLDITAIAGTNEVQTVTITGTPTGGTFTLTYSGQTTAAIAYNAAASAVQSALEALSNIAPGDVVVTGSAGGPYTLTFGGTLASTNVAQLTSSGASLTGGSSPAVAHATTTAGVAPVLGTEFTTGPTASGPWAVVGEFTDASTVSEQRVILEELDEYLRLVYTITGGSVTFSISGELI